MRFNENKLLFIQTVQLGMMRLFCVVDAGENDVLIGIGEYCGSNEVVTFYFQLKF